MRRVGDIGIVGLANLAFGISQWLMFWAVARFGSVEQAGAFGLSAAVVVAVVMVTNAGLRPLLSSMPLDSGADELEFIRLRVWLSAASVALLVPVGIGLWGDGYAFWMLLGLGVGRAAEAVGDISMGVLQRRGMFRRNAANMLGRSVFGGVVFAVAMMAEGVVVASWIYAAATLAAVVSIELRGVLAVVGADLGQLVRVGSPGNKIKLLDRAFPLGLTAVLLTLLPVVPRWLLEAFTGAAGVALYVALFQLVQAGLVVATSLGQYLSPNFVRLCAGGQGRVALVKAGLACCFFAVGGAIMAAVSFLEVIDFAGMIFGEAFAGHEQLMGWMFLFGGLGCAANVVGFAVTAAGVRAGQVVSTALVVGVSFVANLLLVRAEGVEGAVAAYGIVVCVSLSSLGALLLWRLGKAGDSKE